MNEAQTTLHYVYDPSVAGAMVPPPAESRCRDRAFASNCMGGLWMGADARPWDSPVDYVRPHDERASMPSPDSALVRYFNELLLNESLLLDSEPPIRAVLAVSEQRRRPCLVAPHPGNPLPGWGMGRFPDGWRRASRGSRG